MLQQLFLQVDHALLELLERAHIGDQVERAQHLPVLRDRIVIGYDIGGFSITCGIVLPQVGQRLALAQHAADRTLTAIQHDVHILDRLTLHIADGNPVQPDRRVIEQPDTALRIAQHDRLVQLIDHGHQHVVAGVV